MHNRRDLHRNDNQSIGNMNQSSSLSWSQPVRNDEASQSSKSFFGRTSKNFAHSDQRIFEEVSEALLNDHSIDSTEIEVHVQDGNVTLSGTVSNRLMKGQAEDCVASIPGVSKVKNEIQLQ